jgi:hypothetical protein
MARPCCFPAGEPMRTILILALLWVPAFLVQAQDPPKKAAPKLPWELLAIQEAWAWGVAITYDHEQTGLSKTQVRYELSDGANGEISKVRTVIYAKDDEREDTRTFVTWQAHYDSLTADFMGAAESDEDLKIGEITYKCRCFTSGKDAKALSRKVWYAKELPGMWVKYFVERDKSSETFALAGTAALYHNPGWVPSDIAKSLKAGATFKYRYTDEKGAVTYFLLAFTLCNDKGYTEVITYYNKDGLQDGAPESQKSLWSRHARTFAFARTQYKASETVVQVGEEKIECVNLTLEETRGDATRVVVTTLGKKVPGAIIARKTSIKTKDVEFKTSIELVEYRIEK